eukprot:COSAG01_NODE_5352_length_4315_cov_51.182638_4_plen_188_part_00
MIVQTKAQRLSKPSQSLLTTTTCGTSPVPNTLPSSTARDHQSKYNRGLQCALPSGTVPRTGTIPRRGTGTLPFGMTVRVANSDHGGLAVTFLSVATVLASSCSSRCLHPLSSWCWLRTDSTVTERMSWVSGCWQGMLAGCQSGCAPAVGACPRACLRCLAILPVQSAPALASLLAPSLSQPCVGRVP